MYSWVIKERQSCFIPYFLFNQKVNQHKTPDIQSDPLRFGKFGAPKNLKGKDTQPIFKPKTQQLSEATEV